MSRDVASAVTRGQMFWRVGRGADPWQFVDWIYADHDGRFDGRWDDPDGTYRVLYACDSRFGAYVEVLADFRPDPEVAAGLADIVSDHDDEDAGPEPGKVPRSWMEDRAAGRASVTGQLAEVGNSRSLAVLRDELAGLLVRYRLDDLDASAIRVSAPRAFTQQLSRFIYECTDELGDPQFDGIQYLSRLGDDLTNLAIFELPQGGAEVSDVGLAPLEEHDEDLQRAMHHHGLAWLTIWPDRPSPCFVVHTFGCRRRGAATGLIYGNRAAYAGMVERARSTQKYARAVLHMPVHASPCASAPVGPGRRRLDPKAGLRPDPG